MRSCTAASLDALASPELRHVFGRHVHHQTLYYREADASLMEFAPTPGVAIPLPRHRHWLAALGSVGPPRAMHALFDTSRLQLAFQRVAYDYLGAAAAIGRAGLFAYFADRLETGQ